MADSAFKLIAGCTKSIYANLSKPVLAVPNYKNTQPPKDMLELCGQIAKMSYGDSDEQCFFAFGPARLGECCIWTVDVIWLKKLEPESSVYIIAGPVSLGQEQQ